MEPSPVSRRLTWILVAVGLVLAVAPTLAAGFVMCGVSGCSGGGFGVSTDPDLTRILLVVAGVVAAVPLATYAVSRRSRSLGLGAAGLAVGATLVAGLVIGSDLAGCPRELTSAQCHVESR